MAHAANSLCQDANVRPGAEMSLGDGLCEDLNVVSFPGKLCFDHCYNRFKTSPPAQVSIYIRDYHLRSPARRGGEGGRLKIVVDLFLLIIIIIILVSQIFLSVRPGRLKAPENCCCIQH